MLRRIPKQAKLSPRAKPLALEARKVRRRKAPLRILRLTCETAFDGRWLDVRAQYSDLQPRWIVGKPGAWQGVRLTPWWEAKLDKLFEEAMAASLF